MHVLYQHESNVEVPTHHLLQGQNYLLLAMGHIVLPLQIKSTSNHIKCPFVQNKAISANLGYKT